MAALIATCCSLLLLISAIESPALAAQADTPTCMDDNGNPVDWYIVYKLPSSSGKEYPFKTGYSYAYMTSEVMSQRAAPKWTISSKLITEPESMVLRTLRVAYENGGGAKGRSKKRKASDELAVVFYNDHPPNDEEEKGGVGRNNRRAHSKGVVVVDEASGDGFWLTHSTPKWPPMRSAGVEKLTYADNSRVYGQTLMCLNFDLNESGKAIFQHLIMMQPQVYEASLSPDMRSWFPELADLEVDAFKGRRQVDGAESRLAQSMVTRGGQQLSLFSKSPQFQEDFFSGWLDEELDANLMVQTWRKGSGNHLDSSCPPMEHHVNNVAEMQVQTTGYSQPLEWTYKEDHSKWAIGDEEDAQTVCVGDLNRVQSQFLRGGGAVCVKCPNCWSIFNKTIRTLEPCPVRGSR